MAKCFLNTEYLLVPFDLLESLSKTQWIYETKFKLEQEIHSNLKSNVHPFTIAALQVKTTCRPSGAHYSKRNAAYYHLHSNDCDDHNERTITYSFVHRCTKCRAFLLAPSTAKATIRSVKGASTFGKTSTTLTPFPKGKLPCSSSSGCSSLKNGSGSVERTTAGAMMVVAEYGPTKRDLSQHLKGGSCHNQLLVWLNIRAANSMRFS